MKHGKKHKKSSKSSKKSKKSDRKEKKQKIKEKQKREKALKATQKTAPLIVNKEEVKANQIDENDEFCGPSIGIFNSPVNKWQFTNTVRFESICTFVYLQI